VIDLKSFILELGFPRTLEVLERRKCAVETWVFVCREMMKNTVGILVDV